MIIFLSLKCFTVSFYMEILIGYVIKLQFEMMDGSDGKEYLNKGGGGRS